ncbi:CDK5 regulatory subunit-associated protein 3-like [Lytechinus pictus]|uniref:CDK5 regulatory subunit-associated protein 3-like n=1 Tax=Lytechinus pictus TaxID=7653 RepID=UPI0030B9CF33
MGPGQLDICDKMQGTKNGELTAQQIENLPIDISSTKLLDWLIDRRHVNLKWQSAALIIREKINHAIQDMPEVEEIKKLLTGTYINYFHCLRIVELLKVSEESSKNIFGYYSSQRMKDWQEVVKLYEKDNIYLAEAAHMLIRNVGFEIPSLKKQIAKCQQLQAECSKKEKDYAESASSARDEYKQSCKQLGIKGEKIRSELLELVSELPQTYRSIEEQARKLSQVLEFYQAFVQFVNGSDEESMGDVCPMLQYLTQHGNTTVYQWRTGKVPDRVEEVKLSFLEDEEETKDDEIDFSGIDMDTGGIDFGDLGISVENEGAETIDFDIEVGDGTVTESGEGVARGNDALCLFEHIPTRNQFINEIIELQAFLGQRRTEMQGDSDVLTVNQFQTAPTIVQTKTLNDVTTMLSQVDDIYKRLTETRMQHLFLLIGSPKYVDRLTDSLKQKLSLEEKMLASREAVKQKRFDCLEDQTKLEPQVDALVGRTRELQKQIEGDISKRYKNRQVNLMGAINTI